jgi:hypothetical protein
VLCIKGKILQEVDDQFYERADEHIHLSNDQITEEISRGKVSASFMYAVARFNSYVTAAGYNDQEEFSVGKDEAIEYFVSEYRKMLIENMEDYEENFDDYMGTKR